MTSSRARELRMQMWARWTTAVKQRMGDTYHAQEEKHSVNVEPGLS